MNNRKSSAKNILKRLKEKKKRSILIRADWGSKEVLPSNKIKADVIKYYL